MSTLDLEAPAAGAVRCAVLTVSDTRTAESDTSGAAITSLLQAKGHEVVDRRLVQDDPSLLSPIILDWTARTDLRVVITTGGTGIGRRDLTYEAVRGLLQKEIPGFGELFRMLSFREIGAAAMLSRATAGTIDSTMLFVLPGSEHGVRLAMNDLILPQLAHITRELTKTS